MAMGNKKKPFINESKGAETAIAKGTKKDECGENGRKVARRTPF